MFASIIQALTDISRFFSWLFREAWRQAGVMLSSVWAVLLIAAGLVYTVLTHIIGWMLQIFGWISTIVLPSQHLGDYLSGITSWLQIVNTFVPLQEGFVMLTAYLLLRFVLQVVGFLHYVKKIFWAG